MKIIIQILIALVAFEHLFILWIEMFAWTSKGEKFFPHLDAEFLQKTKGMAANQGLYNGFLSAGLIWSLLISNPMWSRYTAIFFLSCVAVAGIFGALTSNKGIFFKQALPALITLALTIFML